MCALLPWIPPGGAAVSAAPTEQAVKKLPRNTPNTQNFLQRKDSHRWHGCAQIRRVWHPCNTHADKFCGFCEFRGRKDIPTERTERTETSGREEPPTDDTDVHRCRRVWHPCHTHAAKFCVFCEFCGRTAHHKYLCKSVKSVGGKRFPQNARNSQKLLAEKSLPQMTRMFTDVGGYGIPAIPTLPNSVNSVNSVGEQRTISICVNL